VFAVIALGALALSAGFAADRVLLTEPASDFTIRARPQVVPHGTSSPRTPQPERTENVAKPVAPLKPVRRETPPPRRITRTTSPPAATPARRPPAATTVAADAEEAVIRLTNEARAEAGCPAVRFDSRLRTAARRHSADMGVHDYFSHDSRDGDTFADRIVAAGYPRPGAENIARGYRTAAAVMEGWMNSAGHRANILNCGLRTIGVGMYDAPGGPWWTQDFGWP
jgi:uncharacterized protein YkwD